MIKVCREKEFIVLKADQTGLSPKHESQLVFWGFKRDKYENPAFTSFRAEASRAEFLVEQVLQYLEEQGLGVEVSEELRDLLRGREAIAALLKTAIGKGRTLKSGQVDEHQSLVLSEIARNLHRPLKSHQERAVLHLLNTINGANFSVPGSGKTAVILAVFGYLKGRGAIDSLFVVGPPACFWPWITEYTAVLGEEPKHEILAGGDVYQRHSKYYAAQDCIADLYLTTFQTVQRDVAEAEYQLASS